MGSSVILLLWRFMGVLSLLLLQHPLLCRVKFIKNNCGHVFGYRLENKKILDRNEHFDIAKLMFYYWSSSKGLIYIYMLTYLNHFTSNLYIYAYLSKSFHIKFIYYIYIYIYVLTYLNPFTSNLFILYIYIYICLLI